MHNFKDKVNSWRLNNKQELKSIPYKHMINNQAAIFQLLDYGMMELFYLKILEKY